MSTIDAFPLPEVDRISTTQQVLRVLREAIVKGTLPPGEQLRETAIATRLGVGRGVVREALGHLVQEGLVQHELNRGAFVRSLTAEEGRDLYFAREAIEVAAVQRALELEDLDLSGVVKALEEIRDTARGGGERPSQHLIECDVAFHHELVELAASPRLSRAYATLAAETQMLLHRHPPYPMKAYVEEHERLFAALSKRDPRTPELLAEHLRLSARLIGEEIASGTQPA
jgi:DNA-binding GntR family transcriptional regulator